MKIVLPVAVAATVLQEALNLETSEAAGLVYAVLCWLPIKLIELFWPH